MWTSTQRTDGGRITPTGTAILRVIQLLKAGSRIRRITGLPRGVAGFAVGRRIMLVNTTRSARIVATGSGRLRVNARTSVFTTLSRALKS